MTHRARPWVFVAALAIVLGQLGCGGSTPSGQTCAAGSLRCPCYGNATCDVGLVCLSNRCVADPDAGPTGTGGASGAGGTGTGTAGQAGSGAAPGSGGVSGAGGTGAGGTGAGGTGTGGSGTGGSATGGGGAGTTGTGGRGGGTAGTTGTGGRGGGSAGTTGTGGRGGGGAGTTGTGGRGGGGAGTTGTGGGVAGTTGTGGRGGGGGSGGGSGTVGSGCRAGVGGAGVHAFICGPAVTSAFAQSIDVFAVGADGKVRWRQYDAGWSSWQLLPGTETITSDVDVTEVGLSTYDVYGLGATGKVVHSHWGNGNWQTVWEDFTFGQTGVSPALYGVAATLTGLTQSTTVTAWLFATGPDGGLLSRDANSSSVWGPWGGSFGGSLSSAPDAVSRAAATWVVARGPAPTDIVIDKNATNLDGPGQWSGFTTLPHLAGGTTTTFSYGPCITAWSDTRLDVFAPGGGATSLWHNSSTDGGASWASTWDDWGGGPSIVASPDCVSWGSGRIDIVVVGADGHLWRRGYEGSLIAWEDLGVY